MPITIRPRHGTTNWASILIPGTRFWYIYIMYLLLVVTKFDWFYSNPVQTILAVIAFFFFFFFNSCRNSVKKIVGQQNPITYTSVWRRFIKFCFFGCQGENIENIPISVVGKIYAHSKFPSSFGPMFRQTLLLVTVCWLISISHYIPVLCFVRYHSLIDIFSNKYRIDIRFTHVSVPRAMSDPLGGVVPHTTTSLAGASLDLPLFLGDEERRVWFLHSFHLSEGR